MDLIQFPELVEKGESGVKRLTEINSLIQSFYGISQTPNFEYKFGTNNISLIDNAAEEICETYYKNLRYFKTFMQSKDGETAVRVSRYKIISGLEIAIKKVQPFKDKDNGKQVNSYFALFVAIGFLMAWEETDDVALLDYAFPNLDPSDQKEIHKLLIEHIDWLCIDGEPSHLDYFSNAQTWWSLRMLLKELNSK